MKKKHKLLIILLVVVLCFSLLGGLIACDDSKKDPTEDAPVDSGKYISNGNFILTNSEIFPKIPSSWNESAGSTSSGNATSTKEEDLVSGVIDTNEEIYNKNKKSWGKLDNPGKTGEDDNILMIYNKKSNSYKYTSSSFSLDASKYFKISIDVKTIGYEAGDAGAFVGFTGDANKEFAQIKTNGEWKTYSLYVKTSDVANNSFSVVLSNGKLGLNDGKLSKGYALFDNVLVTETNEGTFNSITAKGDISVTETDTDKIDLKLGDSQFTNFTYATSSPYSARQWTGVSSVNENDDSAPTGSDYLARGIIDANNTPNYSIFSSSYTNAYIKNPNAPDPYQLLIYNKLKTAYSYRSDKKIKIAGYGTNDTSNYYKLTFSILQNIEDNGSVGAVIRLKTSTDKIGVILEYIATPTTFGWTDYSVFVKSDDIRDKEIYIELGFGTGGKDSEQNAKGYAVFDTMRLDTVTEQEYTNADADAKVSIADSGKDIFENNSGSSNVFLGNGAASKYAKIDNKTGAPDGGHNIAYADDTLTINHSIAGVSSTRFAATNTVSDLLTNGNLIIKQKQYYRLTLNVKTIDIDSKKGITISLYRPAKQVAGEVKGDDELLTSITTFNTQVIKKDSPEKNGYQEVVFLVQGALFENAEVYFTIDIGSGTGMEPKSHVKGSVSINSILFESLNYSDYNSESGTYVKKSSIAETEAVLNVTNGQFNSIDIAGTADTFKTTSADNDKQAIESQIIANNYNRLYMPATWSSSDKKILADNSNFNAGVFDIENTAQQITINADDTLVNSLKNINDIVSNKRVLVFQKGSSGNTPANWAFTSPSLKLTKDSYNKLSIFVYNNLSSGSINVSLKSSSKAVIDTINIAKDTNSGKWQEYSFYLKTGFDDSTVYLDVATNDDGIEGSIFFDYASNIGVTEDQYKLAVEKESETTNLTLSTYAFTTTNFDNYTPSEDSKKFDTPTNWTGTNADNDSPRYIADDSDIASTVAGIYNIDSSNRDLFGISDNDRITSAKLREIMSSVPDETINNNIFVINNKINTEYKYSTTLSSSMITAESYYVISLYARTFAIPSEQHATISLRLHNTTFTYGKDDSKGINVNHDAWKKYTFAIATDKDVSVQNVVLSVALGGKGEENYANGYVFIDNLSITKLDDLDAFNAAYPEDKYTEGENGYDTTITSTNSRIFFKATDLLVEEPVEDEKTSDPLLWLYITSGIIGGLVVLVVIVFLVKKFYKPKKKSNFSTKGNEKYNRNRINDNKSKTSTKDISDKYKD